MAGEILTAAEVFSGEDVQAAPSGVGKGVYSPQEVFGENKPVTPTVNAIPDEHRVGFIQALGERLYLGLQNGATKWWEVLAGQVVPSISKPGTWERPLSGLDPIVEAGKGVSEQLASETQPRNLAEQIPLDFAQGIGNLVSTLPVDIMSGAVTKMALVGRILPEMTALLSKIPDFAIGMGWEGVVKGIEESDGPLEGVYKGIVGGLESTAWGMLYASAGVGAKGIGKMASLGLASTVYEAAKEGRLPSIEEATNGLAQGAAMGLVFTALPSIIEGTKNAGEKAALREYQRKVDKALGKSDIKSGKEFSESLLRDPGDFLLITDNLLNDKRIRPEIRQALAQPFVDMLDRRGDIVVPELKLGQWKDAGILSQRRETMERIIEGIAKGDAGVVKEFSTERIKENETYRARWETLTRGELRNNLLKWNIKPGSLDDKLVMRYGEGRATLASVQVDSPKNWQNIVEASKWFRGQYDSFLDTINSIREKYDYEPIQKRADYFRHFQELGAAEQVFGLVLGGESVPTAIAGIVRKPKPGKPFTPVELKRLGSKTTESAVGGYDNYINSASKQIFHTDSVQRMRALDNYIRNEAMSNDTINLANFVTNMRDYTDILAGQPADIDRSVERTIGRTAYGVLRWLDRRTAANMIAGNVSAALSNNIVFTQSLATTPKIAALRGLWTSVMTPFNRHFFKIDGVESDLFARRYPDYKVSMNFWESTQQGTNAFFQAVDQFAVKAMLAGKYYENRGKGLSPEEAMKAASDYTGRAVTDRSWGQLPTLMESKSLRVITRFQTEVNNMVSFLQKDIPDMYKGDVKKIVGAYAQFMVYSWVFNNLFEEVSGRRPTIDPIYMFATLMGVNKSGRGRPFVERLEPAVKDFVGQLPFGNMLVDGGRFPVLAGVPDVNKMMSEPSWGTTFAELSKPLYYLAMPFGGGQLKKTIGGMYDFAKGVSLTPSGDERYGIHQDFRNFLQGFVFGKNAFPEAVRYWSLPKDER